jgi:HNH endonuclease
MKRRTPADTNPCKSMSNAIKPIPPLTEKDKFRFYQKVSAEPDANGCLNWIGGKDPEGRGQFKIREKQFRAPRIAYYLAAGNLSSDVMVLHSCDNPSCCNPDHLRTGSQFENMADVTRRKRWKRAGTSNGRCRLDEAKVREIRALRKGGMTLTSIGQKFGITFSTVHSICIGKLWKHIT